MKKLIVLIFLLFLTSCGRQEVEYVDTEQTVDETIEGAHGSGLKEMLAIDDMKWVASYQAKGEHTKLVDIDAEVELPELNEMKAIKGRYYTVDDVSYRADFLKRFAGDDGEIYLSPISDEQVKDIFKEWGDASDIQGQEYIYNTEYTSLSLTAISTSIDKLIKADDFKSLRYVVKKGEYYYNVTFGGTWQFGVGIDLINKNALFGAELEVEFFPDDGVVLNGDPLKKCSDKGEEFLKTLGVSESYRVNDGANLIFQMSQEDVEKHGLPNQINGGFSVWYRDTFDGCDIGNGSSCSISMKDDILIRFTMEKPRDAGEYVTDNTKVLAFNDFKNSVEEELKSFDVAFYSEDNELLESMEALHINKVSLVYGEVSDDSKEYAIIPVWYLSGKAEGKAVGDSWGISFNAVDGKMIDDQAAYFFDE
ncbi:MAG: hypothetical protein IKQ71_00050 [Lachnospiraceae bacterium]|nr:hypothetical protein [Lachnospiraceae bacterium]